MLKYLVRKIPRKYLIKLSYIFNKFAPLIYYGNKVHCPICGGSFRKFLPYGAKTWREDRLCPKCLSLDRHRLLWHYLQERTTLFTGKNKLLHIAPEQCFYAYFKKSALITYITADLESPLADVKMDIVKMPFADKEFDFVLCNHVLEHIPDDYKAMSEIYRIMKKGAIAILNVPLDKNRGKTLEDPAIDTPEKRKKHYWAHDHVRLYGLDYKARLESVGFIVEPVSFYSELTEDTVKKEKLVDITIWVVKK